MAATIQVSDEQLVALEAELLNTSGNVPLHNRFRSLFTLKSLKTETAVQIISKGILIAQPYPCIIKYVVRLPDVSNRLRR